MTPLLEDDIERWAIETLIEQGWTHVPGPELLPGQPHAERERLQDVVLKHRLRSAVQRLNPGITPRALDVVKSAVTRIVPTDLLAANEEFHHKLTDGVKVEVSAGGETRGECNGAGAGELDQGATGAGGDAGFGPILYRL